MSNAITTEKIISSWMNVVDYNETTSVAILTMKAGHSYKIYNISPQTHREWLRAHSTGRYFNRWIRPFHKIERL